MIIVCVYCVATIGDAKRYNFALASDTEENTFSVQSSKYISVPFIIRIGLKKLPRLIRCLKLTKISITKEDYAFTDQHRKT